MGEVGEGSCGVVVTAFSVLFGSCLPAGKIREWYVGKEDEEPSTGKRGESIRKFGVKLSVFMCEDGSGPG